MYSRAYGPVTNRYRWVPPTEAALRVREFALLAQRPGVRRLCVWPALLLYRRTLTHALRNQLGRATFRGLEALTTRISATAASDLLSLAPQLAVLDLQVVNNAAAQTENVLSVIAERLPRLRKLTVRYCGDFAVDL
jgi:hypothetical protein